MVDIAPKFNPGENAPNWTGSSQKPDASLYRGDKTFETLFSGVGDLVTQGTKATYEGITNRIKDTWNSVFEPVRDAQGVGDATQGSNVGVTAPAAGLGAQGQGIPAATSESFAERAQKLSAAHADGKISNAYYYSQLNALTRSVKAQFPGFGEEVDAIVQKTTGVVPANALRNAMLEKLDAAATKAEKEKTDRVKFVRDNIGNFSGELRRQIVEAQARGEDIGKFYNAAFAQQAEVDAKDAETKREVAQLNLADKQGDNTARQAGEIFTRRANDLRGTVFREAIDALGGPNSPIMKALSGQGTLSGQQIEQINAAAQNLESNYRQALDQLLDRPDATGKSLRERMKPTEVDNFIAQQMAAVTQIKKSITDDKSGLAGHQLRIMTANETDAAARIRQQYPVTAAIGAMQKAGVPKEIIQMIYQGEQDVQAPLIKATRETFLPKITTGQMNAAEYMQKLKEARPTREQYMTEMGRFADLLSQPTPSKAQYDTARALFASGNIVDKHPQSNFEKGNAGDGSNLFVRLMRPDVAAQMKKLDAQYPGIYKQYQSWALTNAQYSFRQLGNNLGANMDNKYVKFDWDPGSNQFVARHTPAAVEFLRNRGTAKGQNVLDAMSMQDSSVMRTLVAMDALNKSLLVVNPILKEQNTETTQALNALFKSWGIDKEKPENPGFFKSLWDAISKHRPKEGPGDPNASPGLNKSLFGSSSVVNFQTASGGNRGTGSINLDPTKVTPRGNPDLSNLNEPTKKLLKGLEEDGTIDEIRPISGYRDPQRNAAVGGAKASRHIEGKAIDLDVGHMTDEQKAKVLEAAIRHGARGIGIYPGGRSIHIDTREGAPATWGYSPFGKYQGVHWSAQPAWAQPALKKLLGD